MKLLDDAGRATLKAGDEVLVRVTIRDTVMDGAGDLGIFMRYAGGKPVVHWVYRPDIYALLPRPIAVGDKLIGRNREHYTCIGHTSDGKVVVEYQAGDGTNVIARDASCFERVS